MKQARFVSVGGFLLSSSWRNDLMGLDVKQILSRTLSISIFLAALGCQKPAGSPPATAAAAEKPKVESDLSRTTLSVKNAASLGIQTAPVKNREVQQTIQLTGWVMIPPGNEVTITSPVAGYIRAPIGTTGTNAITIAAGLPVAKGQDLFSLEPVLTPVELIQMASLKRGVEGEMAKAKESVNVAKIELQRMEGLAKQGIRQQQDVEQARARLKLVEEDQAAAEDKLRLFAQGETGGQLRPYPIQAPRAGTVLTFTVSPGQYVAAAAPLLTIADLSHFWLRVPLPESDLPRVARQQPASLLSAARDEKQPRTASSTLLPPITIVPLVDLIRHTADMIFDIPPTVAAGTLAKDQMLTVLIPLGDRREESVVPYSALVFDAYGSSWLYLETTPKDAKQNTYERRRVQLGATVNDEVVVRPKLKDGDKLVVAGAAALFSREFYKTPIRDEDEK